MATERQHPSVEIVGQIAGEEVIAVGGKIREIERRRKAYGRGRWRKMKGVWPKAVEAVGRPQTAARSLTASRCPDARG
jgi:alkyl sulfatase BDS1-like metallo-beta-lactamase superfamily hydrolase